MKLVDFLVGVDTETPVHVYGVDENDRIVLDIGNGREMWMWLLDDVVSWSVDTKGVFLAYVRAHVERY